MVVSLLEKIGNTVVERVRFQMAAQDRNATGKTAKAVRYAIEGNTVTVFAPFHVRFLNDGRPPTRVREGRGELVKSLIEWCKARGIPEKGRFAIAKKIHKEGYKGDKVIDNVFTNDLQAELQKIVRADLQDLILKQFGL